LGVVDLQNVFAAADRRTPTYTKPMLCRPGEPPRELNRLDIKNRTPLPGPLEDLVLQALPRVMRQTDALIVLDQVSEENCGVVTTRVREELARRAEADPTFFVLADSRARIEQFRAVCLKPNSEECLRANAGGEDVTDAARALALRAGAVVFCTQ